MYVELILNTSLIVALTSLHGLLSRLNRFGETWGKVFYGLLFGCVAMVGMQLPFHYAPGVIYDGRSIILSMAGLFGGGTAAVVSMILAGAYRAHMGGAGVWAGLGTIIGCAMVGLAFRRSYGNRPDRMGFLSLYGFGICVHIVMLVCQLLIQPWPSGLSVINRIWMPILIIFPAVTVLMGLFLGTEERRILAERSLRESESLLLKSQSIGQVGSWEFNVDGNRLSWSDEVYRIFGLRSQQFEATYEAFLEFVHPDDRASVDAAYQESIKQGKDGYQTEHRIVRRDSGEVRIVHEKCEHLKDSTGRIVRSIGMVQDITERKRAEEKVQSLARYPSENPNPVLRLGQDGTVLDANSASRHLLRDWGCVVGGRAPLFWQQVASETLASKANRTVDTACGDITYSFCITPIVETGYVNLYARDITERKHAEEKLQVLSARNEAILSSVPDIIMEVDNNKIYTWANQTGMVFFGEDVIGKEASFYFEGEQQTDSIVNPLFAGSENIVYVESWQRRQDGEKRLLAWWCRVLKDRAGVVTGALSTARDITEKRAVEAEIRELNRNLELRVHKRTVQLEEASKELEDFVYSVSHDLRAPLRSISGFAEIIDRRHKASLNEEGRHYIENIVKASRQMGDLIDDLLKFSRLGRKAIKPEPVPLDDVLNSVIKTLSDRIKKTNGRINLPEQMPVILGNSTLATHIFINLLENALKYHKPNEPPRIDISLDFEDSYVIISIADNGIGIGSEYHEKIFNIFQRLHSQEAYPGTGIGLAAVKKGVQIMGGRVWVESEFGKGSVFKIKALLVKTA